MKKQLKQILFYLFQFLLIPLLAYAAGKATVSSSNQTAIPLAGVNSSGEMVAIRVDDDGYVLTTCAP